MFGKTSNPVRNALGAAAVGGAALLTSFSAAGQQLVNVQRDRAAAIAAACNHIPNLNQRTGCIAQASIRFDEGRIAAAKQTTAAADQRAVLAEELQRCVAFLGQKRDTGTIFDRAITRENVCPYARELGMN